MSDVVLLWHMHQPYYVDPVTSTAMMPWVRLHAAKGYLDMIDVVRRFPGVRANFNFTPVLVRQIHELANRQVNDLWETWSRKDPDALEDTEKSRLLEDFFKINWKTHIEPNPRYLELLEQRGRDYNLSSLKESIHHFTRQDYLDLQVWYNLAWCGFSAFQRWPELAALKTKGHGFTSEEKHRVLDIHQEILGLVLKLYREAQDDGQIELTTTPYFHPIMPLVYDTDFAKRCMPWATLPPRFQAPGDVRRHLLEAQKLHTETFGKPARGLWPSEGSVAPELLPLFKEAGIEYFCTDEDVLFNSLRNDPAWQGHDIDHLELFQPWTCSYGDTSLKALFRERPLSDFIGFNAANNTPEAGSDHLLHHLEHLASVAKSPNAVVCLALDGENAWEAFQDGGEGFLSLLYQKLQNSAAVKTQRLGDVFDQAEPVARTTTLHTGSWIAANFDIWIGDPEENKGWEWLGKTRAFLTDYLAKNQVPEDKADAAWFEIFAAEGSDWFWWYGPDFQIDTDFLFDSLFRQHLKNTYLVLGVEPPSYLDAPIRQRGLKITYTTPFDIIAPVIDGRNNGFFDWHGAGFLDMLRQHTAMFQSDRIGKQLRFGFDEKTFYLRFDYQRPPGELLIPFTKPESRRIRVAQTPEGRYTALLETSTNGVDFTATGTEVRIAHDERIELSVPLEALGFHGQSEACSFLVQILQNGIELERAPERGLIEFEGPSNVFKLRHWLV
jgi:alpha-amylase/alpha-mannosidase (GH57 family)